MYTNWFVVYLVLCTAISVCNSCEDFSETVCSASQSVFSCSEHRTLFLTTLPQLAHTCDAVESRWATNVYADVKHCDAEIKQAYETHRIDTKCPHAVSFPLIGNAKTYHNDMQTIYLSLLGFVYVIFDAIIVGVFYSD